MDKETPDTSLMQSRLSKISEIANVLRGCDELIDALSERFQWDKKLSLAEQQNTKVQCPFNVNHLMDSNDLDNHVTKCRMKEMGFTPCKSSSQFYEKAPSVVSITPDVTTESNCGEQAVPSEFHVFTYTPEERLNQYDNDVKVTSTKRKADREKLELELSESPQDSKETSSENPKSELELLAEQRDYKRRRQSYRAKNVHITKRTPIEITREIINNRMQELENMFYDEKRTARNDDK